jgi:spore photoproduct lyase
MKIKRIFLAEHAALDGRAHAIIRNFRPAKVYEVADLEAANEFLEKFSDPPAEGKQSLYLSRFQGGLFNPCPCTRECLSCGYYNLNPVMGCPIDCSYCVLQGYLNSLPISVHLNLEDFFKEIENFSTLHPGKRLRLGTGELADSLALEPELGFAQEFIEYFDTRKNFIFELKTKTDRIAMFEKLKASEQTVVSWSVNPKEIARAEEKSAADIGSRLQSAKTLAGAGWQVGFHFDPILDFAPAEKYLELVDEIFKTVPVSRIAFISLGALRFMPSLKPVIIDRHPKSRVLCGELFPGKDGKLRYLRPVREKLFRKLIQRICGHSDKVLVYLCMETRQMWEKLLAENPALIIRELALPISERKRFRPG